MCAALIPCPPHQHPSSQYPCTDPLGMEKEGRLAFPSGGTLSSVAARDPPRRVQEQPPWHWRPTASPLQRRPHLSVFRPDDICLRWVYLRACGYICLLAVGVVASLWWIPDDPSRWLSTEQSGVPTSIPYTRLERHMACSASTLNFGCRKPAAPQATSSGCGTGATRCRPNASRSGRQAVGVSGRSAQVACGVGQAAACDAIELFICCRHVG